MEGLRDEVGVNIDVNMRIIVEKAHQSSMENAERVSDIHRQMEDLRRRLKETEEEKAAAQEVGREETKQKETLKNLLSKNEKQVEKQADLLKLFQEKDILNQQDSETQKELDKMEEDMNKYVKKNDHYVTYLILEICLLIVFLVSIGLATYQMIVGKRFTITAIIAGVSLLITLFTALTRKTLFVIEIKGIHDEIKLKAKDRWLMMNPEYMVLKNNRDQIENRLSEINLEISKSNF